ncbi:GNAT family N-acetyltransferase [Ideonella sp. BN130291]|uniref:GNAT family N-acetyltransferase n=1 Tax=Ideonella sp. BN130291 TaxID=3112940 RepID=UPI002E264A7C|nr:GNAT family protein [Ideonella sp. BN130291]
MLNVAPVTLANALVRLEPLSLAHVDGLKRAAADGELWTLRFTSVPDTDDTLGYVQRALQMQAEGHRLPFAVVEVASGEVIGCTSYHDIVPAIDRLEIGWTWYAQRTQRTHVNTTAKLLLLTHAFEVLGAKVVGWRTDNFNLRSQRAIERLGAKRDGVIRHHALRRDGTVRDTVMYSLLAGEWPEVRAHLQWQLKRER